MCDKSLNVPNNLIKRCKTKQDGFTYKYLAVFVKLRLKSNGFIEYKSDSFVSKQFGINKALLERAIPMLLNIGLIQVHDNKIWFASDSDIQARFSDINYINKIDFSSCSSVCDYSDMLKLSIVQLKISQMAYALKSDEDKSRDITNDFFVKNYIPDIDPDVNMCLSYASIARMLGEKSKGIYKMMKKHEKRGTLHLKTLYYDVRIEGESVEIRFARKTFTNNNSKKTRVTYGSVIKINSVTSESMNEPMVRYVKTHL